MHELAVTEGILQVVVDTARRNGERRITTIDLVIGLMSSIVDDSIQFYFDFLSKGTLAEGATLRFRREPALAVCLDCGHEFDGRVPLIPACPQCGGVHLRVSGGRDFYVESIEVQDRADEARSDSSRPESDGGGELARSGASTVPELEVNQ